MCCDSDSVTRVNDSNHDIWLLWLDSSPVEKYGVLTRVESRFSQNNSTRLKSQSMTWDSKSESFSPNLWASDERTLFVCIVRNEQFLLPWWSNLARIFCFDCLFVLCYRLIQEALYTMQGCANNLSRGPLWEGRVWWKNKQICLVILISLG